MVVTGEVFLMVNAGSILTHSHRTGVGAGVDIQYARHLLKIIFLILNKLKCKNTDFSAECCIFA
jgi:hypothetical protein